MISLDEACKIALKAIPEPLKVIEVTETPLFWVFADERFEAVLIGPSPLVVFKEDGRIATTASLTDEEFSSLDQEKAIPFPDCLVQSGRVIRSKT